jgi:hypothetical protein
LDDRRLYSTIRVNNPPDWEPAFQSFEGDAEREHDYRPEDYWRHGTPCDMNQTEKIYHAGGLAVYPSVSSKMVPFWKQIK